MRPTKLGFRKTLLAGATTLSLLLGGAALAPQAHAQLIDLQNPNLVFDSFKNFTTNPGTPQGYWWRTLTGNDGTNFSRAENTDCHLDVCVKAMKEGYTTFARLLLKPQQHTGMFNLTEISEERDGFTYGQPHRWLPEVGRPVVMKTRFRFSDQYKADASGAAVGSAGIWMWNAPIDIPNNTVHFENYHSFGFSWSDPGTFGGTYKGLKANVISGTLPPSYTIDLPNVNINDWVNTTVIWSADENNQQNLKFYVNGSKVGETDLANPLPELTVEIWNDNQLPQLTANGVEITYQNPSSQQNMDIDYFTLFQP